MVLSNSIMRHLARRLLTAWASGMLLASAAHAQTAALPASVFENYRPYSDDPIGNWKAANDTTARIGGWREYAKQAQGLGSKSENTPASPTKTGEAMPEPVKKAKP